MFSVVFVVCVLTFHVTSLFLPLSVFMYTFGLSQGPRPALPLRGWGVDLGELGTITQTYLSSLLNFTNNSDKHTTHPTSTCFPHTHCMIHLNMQINVFSETPGHLYITTSLFFNWNLSNKVV